MSATLSSVEKRREAPGRERRQRDFVAERALPQSRKPRVLFLNRSYWPDGEATGQLLTELTEDLAKQFDVSVIAGRPNVNLSGATYHRVRAQVRNDVRMLRVPHFRLAKQYLPFRAINLATFFGGAVCRGLFCRRSDIVVVETDPFLLALAGRLLRWRHGANLVIYMQDIHPDLGVAIGRLREGMLTRTLESALRRAYRMADRVVVLSEDMRATLLSKGVSAEVCVTIPNWIDTRELRPNEDENGFRKREGISASQFVVMYSGNLGATQLLGEFLSAARRLGGRSDILFALIGAGSGEDELRRRVEEERLENVRFFPYQPKELLRESLTAADLHFLSTHPKALGYLMPSKLYGILAAGRPVLAAVPSDSELSKLIENEEVGTVVRPDDDAAIAGAITTAVASPQRLAEQGRRARQLAEMRYDRRVVTERFGCLLTELAAGKNQATSREAA